MPALVYRAVADVDFSAFTTAFNLAYSDYFVPVVMTVPSFRALIERDDLDLSASVAALDGDAIVGTGLLGIRDTGGWIGGMGVIPERRRAGIGRQMMLYLLERARERQLARIDLEVIEQNKGAYVLYQQLGFEDQRFLLILEREPGHTFTSHAEYTITDQPAHRLLDHYADFHPVPNAWQRGLPSLQALVPHLQGWGVVKGNSIIGYALGWAGESQIRLLDVAVSPAYADAGIALLTHLHRQFPDAHTSIYNVADNDPVLPAYHALGYAVTLRQIEMRLELTRYL